MPSGIASAMNTEGKKHRKEAVFRQLPIGLSLNSTVVWTDFHYLAIGNTFVRLYLDNLLCTDFDMKFQSNFESFFHNVWLKREFRKEHPMYWTTSLGLCFLKKKRYSVRAEYQSVVSLFAFRLIHYATKVYKLFNITNFSEKLFHRSSIQGANPPVRPLTPEQTSV